MLLGTKAVRTTNRIVDNTYKHVLTYDPPPAPRSQLVRAPGRSKANNGRTFSPEGNLSGSQCKRTPSVILPLCVWKFVGDDRL